jgi:hypothetical protein
MGMFDTVWVPCANCGKLLDYQSKAGPCEMNEYTLDTAPPRVQGDLAGEELACVACGNVTGFRVIVVPYVTRRIRL